MLDVDVITVSVYQCVHCKAHFMDRDPALEHFDTCEIRNALAGTNYPEKDYGNMILKEGAI